MNLDDCRYCEQCQRVWDTLSGEYITREKEPSQDVPGIMLKHQPCLNCLGKETLPDIPFNSTKDYPPVPTTLNSVKIDIITPNFDNIPYTGIIRTTCVLCKEEIPFKYDSDTPDNVDFWLFTAAGWTESMEYDEGDHVAICNSCAFKRFPEFINKKGGWKTYDDCTE